MLRALRWLIVALLVLVAATVALARIAPVLFTPVIESVAQRAGYSVAFDDISVAFFPLEVSLAGLQVSGNDIEAPFALLSDAKVSIGPIDFLTEDAWLGGEFIGARFVLDRLPVSDAAVSEADPASAELDLAPLAQLKRLVFSDVSVFQSADLPPILTLGGSASPYVQSAPTNGLDFSIAGEVLDLAVDVGGRLEYGATPRLVITARRFDLSPLLAVAADQRALSTTSDTVELDPVPRQPIDLRSLAGASFEISLVDAGAGALAVAVQIGSPTLAVSVTIDELLGFRDVVPLASADFLPLQLALAVHGDVDKLSYEFTEFDWGPNSLVGSGSIDFAPLRITSTLKASTLHFPGAGSETGGVEPNTDEFESGTVFSDAPIDWSWLATTSVDVQLSVLELYVLDAVFSDVKMQATGGDGELALGPMTGSFGNGGFDGSLTLSQREEGVALLSAFELDGVDLQAFGFVPEEELTGGALIARIGLAGEGGSVAAIAGSLEGSILVTVQDALVQNDTFELVGSDLLMETLSKLNPFAKTDPTTRLDCALVQFEAVEGVLTASNSLVVETEKMEIIGDGTIDLGEETLSIGFSPSSRAGVGVNVGSLVKFLKLGGTLSNPRPTTDAAGLLKSGAAVGAAVSTGGVSLLAEGMFKRLANAGSACERALAGEPILAPSESIDAADQSSTG